MEIIIGLTIKGTVKSIEGWKFYRFYYVSWKKFSSPKTLQYPNFNVYLSNVG